MAQLKIMGKTIDELLGKNTDNMSKRISPNDKIGPDFRVPSRMARQDFSEMTSKGPDMGKVNKPVKKITKEKTTLEGDLGSVDRANPDVIGPNMGQVNAADLIPAAPDMDAMQQAQNMLQPKPFGYKKGGKVKSKTTTAKMASGGKVKGHGCEIKGRTKGRMV